jgi:hypothetical protein
LRQALDLAQAVMGTLANTKEVPMKPNRLMLAGLIVTLIGLLNVLRHSLDIPTYWTPFLVGIGLLVAGAIWSVMCRKSRAS